ncbi:MAG: phospholipid carrier-dependent glycosyltransferase [Terrimicrobiaceae bacterium]
MNSHGRWQLILLIALAAALTLGTSGWGDLYNETDGQYGGAAKVMVRTGSWLIPENDGIPRLVKPPLLYWVLAASMKIFGVNEFAARLPNALAVTFWVGVTFLIGAKMGGTWRGFLAGIILLTSLGTFTLGRIVMPEPMFSAFIAAALYCALRGADHAPHSSGWFFGFWLFAAMASFTKGWHGLLYPLAIVGMAAILCRQARTRLRGLVSWQGALLFTIINLPWYLYVEFRFPGYLHNLLVAEQLGHVAGALTPATSYTDVPRWQFLLLQLAWLFPWSLAFIAATPLIAIHFRRQRYVEPSFPALIVIVWMAVIAGSVLLTGQRQDYYAMSMWPAFALAVAWTLERSRVQPAIVLLAILLGAGLAGLAWSHAIPYFTHASSTTAALAERATAWTTIINFDRAVWTSLRTTAWFALGTALLFALIGLSSRPSKLKLAAIAASAICLDLGAVSGTSSVSPYFSLATVAGDIHRDAPIVYDGGIDTGSSLLFYSDSPVILLDQNPDKDFIVRKFGIGRDRFLTISEFVAFWNSAAPTVLITEESRLADWRKILGISLAPVARCGTQILLKKTP